jgi:4-hydroxybutyryl-CoA dehydratase/vinylacetyl-CoA-Delta-isomerase|tara:strand:+ start:33637 stop:35109 length:1473 start_codon:yes stop_codon:yes gene_type:complete
MVNLVIRRNQHMPLRTSEQFLESLRDGRVVYMLGERAEDVTSHPVLGVAARHSAVEFDLAHDPELVELTQSALETTGETVSRYYQLPRTSEDLLKRRELIEYGSALGLSMPLFIKAIGSDCLNALHIVCAALDQNESANYSERVAKYRDYCATNDLALAGVITDTKGDRSKRPSEQARPDYYVRIVERRDDGIVVSGAKTHITAAPYVNEYVVVPTRAMGVGDDDFAVSFATPVNAPGVKVIARPDGTKNQFDFPLSSRHFHIEGTVIFDNVFVPWEKVFLAGEWQYAGALANTFATWHRFTGLSYKGPGADLMLGMAQLIAEYNGVANASHVRAKITQLIQYAETIRVFARAAAREAEFHAGLAYPNPLLANMGKYIFASGWHDAVRAVQEIAGGTTVTGPAFRDLENPETREYVERYFGGANGVSAENRLRAFKLIMDMTASEYAGNWMLATLHGEGSLEAQRLSMYRQYDVERCVELARKAASIREN